jgi:hypothetical protein
MAHFAELDNQNRVIQIIVISNADVDDIDNVKGLGAEAKGLEFIEDTLGLTGTWKQCSYNNNFRGTFPVMRDQDDIDEFGDFYTVYNEEHDLFIPPMARLNADNELELNPDYVDPMENDGTDTPEVDSDWVNP